MTLNGLGELMTALGVVGLLVGEWRDLPWVRAVVKPVASAGFIVAAIGFGALEARYGNIVLIGLVLGAVGDVCLLGKAKKFFIAGLVSFLLGHIAYVVAFSSLPMRAVPMAIAALVSAGVMVVIARWVFPYAPKMRVPIGAYMTVIVAICATAIGAGAAGAPWMIPVGAVMFAASDISVVRNRFVAPGFVNRLWGLPLYYTAQLLIAWSILAVSR